MSLAAYEDFVYGAGWLDLDDPVAAWRRVHRQAGQVVDRLSGVRELRVLGEDTDLTVGVAGRTWNACAGDRNFPDGEVFTAPIETETRGDVRFSFPAIYGGREVEDVRLRFEGGRVVRSEAAVGQELLRNMLAIDDGASILGEFAIGTNYAVERFTKQILFDEKIGGTCHMAVGAGYPETGSTNRSGLHWDMVCDLRSGGEIHADGELIYRDGRFLPEFSPDLAPPRAWTAARFARPARGYQQRDGVLQGEQARRGPRPGADQGRPLRAGQQLGRRAAEGRRRKRLPEEPPVGRVRALVPGLDRGPCRRHQGAVRVRVRGLPPPPPQRPDRLRIPAAEWRHKEVERAAYRLLQELDAATP